MLDAIKRMGTGNKQQAGELQDLIAAAREERAALSEMLTQVQLHGAKVATAGKAVQQVEEKAAKAVGRVEELTVKLGAIDARVDTLTTIDARIKSLSEAVGQAERLMAPDGELVRQRQAVQQLSAEALKTQASLETLRKEQETLDTLRDELRQATGGMKDSHDRAVALQTEIEHLRGSASAIAQDQSKAREAARETREHTAATHETVKEVEKKLGALAKLQEMSRTTEERITTLNTLSEHVAQKVKLLENQKHTVEHALVESNRLNELVWNMDVQVAKLNEGTKTAARVDETVERIEKLARETAGQLDAGIKSKDAFGLELARLDRERTTLADFVRRHEEKVDASRRELELVESRVRGLQTSAVDLEKAHEALASRERSVAAMTQRVDVLTRGLEVVATQTDEITRKQLALDGLQEGLAQVDDLARKTTWQVESLQAARQDLEQLRREIQEFYKAHAAAAQLRDSLSSDRAALEVFLERVGSFSVSLPELDARMDGITSKLSIVEEGTEKAANLVSIADDLDRQMTRLAGYQQFVERVETRLNALNALTAEVDRKVDDQVNRRAEIDALRSACDSVSLQVTDVQQKLEGVTQVQGKILPLATQVSVLKSAVDKASVRVSSALKDEAEIAEQEKRVTEMLASVKTVATDAADYLKKVEGLSEHLTRSTAIKDEMLDELTRVQGRQRDVASQSEAAEDHLKRLDATFRQLEQRRTQLAFAEKRIAAFEGKLSELRGMSEEIERRISALAAREEVVEAVRKEVEGVFEVSARSKADLEFVEEHRADVLTLKTRVEELVTSIRDTEARLADITAKKRLVDEVQL
nr:hypothetical protein [Acidobacteriota bacterium]